jgi:hypothetical protein
MTKPLSLATHAVLDAYADAPVSGRIALAAALRAAADQVVPVAECRTDRSDYCCERSVKEERSDIRILLHAIAAELEGNHTRSESDFDG